MISVQVNILLCSHNVGFSAEFSRDFDVLESLQYSYACITSMRNRLSKTQMIVLVIYRCFNFFFLKTLIKVHKVCDESIADRTPIGLRNLHDRRNSSQARHPIMFLIGYI